MSDDWNKLKHLVDLSAENARLKAEVERLDDLCKKLGKQHSDISCENIRLRKAGDAMAVMVGHIEITGDAHRMMLELSKDWNAAKEGKPSV